jgi:hypothetical protein
LQGAKGILGGWRRRSIGSVSGTAQSCSGNNKKSNLVFCFSSCSHHIFTVVLPQLTVLSSLWNLGWQRCVCETLPVIVAEAEKWYMTSQCWLLKFLLRSNTFQVTFYQPKQVTWPLLR